MDITIKLEEKIIIINDCSFELPLIGEALIDAGNNLNSSALLESLLLNKGVIYTIVDRPALPPTH